jgi:hypothetical protein
MGVRVPPFAPRTCSVSLFCSFRAVPIFVPTCAFSFSSCSIEAARKLRAPSFAKAIIAAICTDHFTVNSASLPNDYSAEWLSYFERSAISLIDALMSG